jgi:hypothetical protein
MLNFIYLKYKCFQCNVITVIQKIEISGSGVHYHRFLSGMHMLLGSSSFLLHSSERRHACKILLGKHEWKRKLGRYRSRWEDNISMRLRKIGWGVVDLMHLTEDKDQWRVLLNAAMKLRFQ